MKQLYVAATVVIVYGTGLILYESQRPRRDLNTDRLSKNSLVDYDSTLGGKSIRAVGRIEGRTPDIELRSTLAERISEIAVKTGEWVSAGTVLVRLESAELEAHCDLAEANLQSEIAKRERLINGFLPSEIEVAKQQYLAQAAKLAGAEKSYARLIKLAEQHAVSLQTVDDQRSDLHAIRAFAEAARYQFETIKLPPRTEDLMAAEASVKAARSRLQIAQVQLDRTTIVAPIDGRVLSIKGEVGELAGPESEFPLVVMSDVRQLRVLAEIDEFDALNIKVGQRCVIECDAAVDPIAKGLVSVVESQMNRKQISGQWAGERSDTRSRRIWIDLDSKQDLPMGLPVDVYIDVSPETLQDEL